MKKYVLCIDTGGTVTKVVLFDNLGNMLKKESFETPLIDKGLKKEINMELIWNNIKNCIKNITKNFEYSNDIIAISCVGHGKGLYVLGENDTFICNGILSPDRRCLKELEILESKGITGFVFSHQPLLLSWMKKYENDVYKKIRYIFSSKDYIRYMLSGEYSSDYTDLSSNKYLDLNTKKYNIDILKDLDIQDLETILPKIRDFSDSVGFIKRDLAKELGLNENTEIIVGLFDVDACALATGVNDDKTISLTAGTWSINVLASKKTNMTSSNIWNSIFYNKDYYLLEGSSPTSAGNINKIIPILFEKYNSNNIFSFFEEEIKKTDILKSQVYYTPYLYGSDFIPNARASFVGLTSETKISDIIRAIYEGIVYSHKLHIENIEKAAKTDILKIRMSGGAVNSNYWVQMFSDILNYNIETIDCDELGALGAAISAFYGTKFYNSLDETITNMVKIKNVFKPNRENNEKYSKKFEVYKKITSINKEIWDNIIDLEESV